MAVIDVSSVAATEASNGVTPPLIWTVTLDEPVNGEVTVAFRIKDGTGGVSTGVGTQGVINVARPVGLEGVLIFAPNETSATVEASISGDNVDEVDEAVVLELFSPQGATLEGGAPVLRKTGFVRDNDGEGDDLTLAALEAAGVDEAFEFDREDDTCRAEGSMAPWPVKKRGRPTHLAGAALPAMPRPRHRQRTRFLARGTPGPPVGATRR